MIVYFCINPGLVRGNAERPDVRTPKNWAEAQAHFFNLEVTKITENRRRDKTLTIRLTDSEKKKIIAKSRKSKMSTTDFIIACADNAVIKTPEDLRPVVSQLKRIGNNINQIAVKVNSGAVYSVNFDEVINMQNKIYEKVFEIANADYQVH